MASGVINDDGSRNWGKTGAKVFDPLNIFGGSSADPADLGPAPVNPGDPAFSSLLGPDGKLNPNYVLNARPDVGFDSSMPDFNNMLAGINLNKDPLHNLENFASSTDNSPWAQMQLQAEGLNRTNEMDSAAGTNDSGRAQAFSALASHGGVTAGQRERIADQSAKDLMTGRQAVNMKGDQSRLGIMAQDAANKLDVAKMLPGAEVAALSPDLQKANMWSQVAETEDQRKQNLDLSNRDYSTGVDKANIATTVGGVDAQNKYNMDKYSEQMKNYAAYQTAKATAKSGKK